jgi:asparagine synthase (glutamine-hydrolysing)
MCGIAGILYFEQSYQSDPSLVRNMTNAMSHRGPDADGFYVQDQISLGHRRLSIIDLSDSANQPFVDYTGRYQLIFNGEIYNFREIKEQFPDYPFRTSGDTEVIIAAYAKWGPHCLQFLKGMFCFAIWDTSEKELFIARDRMGVKPLYYYYNENCFLFASEIRGLLAAGIVPRKLNHGAIRDFLYFQSIGHPHAIIEGVMQLEAAAYLCIRNRKPEIKKYWDITRQHVDFDFFNTAMVHTRTRELLRNSIQRRLVSDVPLGAFLSGGIDSSAVVGLMAEVSTARPNTFTIGFNEKEFDESVYADLVAKRFNSKHEHVLLDQSVFLQELTNALDVMDTPSGDGVNTYVVSKAIKKSGLSVALSGVGGDELFAGYPFFKQYLNLRKCQSFWGLTKLFRKAGSGLLSMSSSNKMERIRYLLNAHTCSIDCFYPEFRRILSPSLVSKLTTWKADKQTALQIQLKSIQSSVEQFPELSQVSIAEYLGYTQHTLLKDTDQMSMSVSLEVREPFFDHDLVEFVLAIPDRLKFPVYPKSLLVESLTGLLPPEIVHRKKQGFLFPWSIWMKGQLKSFCEQHLENMGKREFIDAEQLHLHWKKFLACDASVRWMELWLFVILEYWMQKNGID